ncbi:DUF58 domain-containing protein [Aeromonas sp. MdU4]|uniref:DUF58 domain-containing protein n=1 Tax=Aeromonas sp. MdU4 TaxID=3342819 RepID=UPI0035BAF109
MNLNHHLLDHRTLHLNHHGPSADPRIHCDYQQLIRLQQRAGQCSLLPHRNSGSVLSGRHQSRFRGRGLNFEELRHYQQGDDIRTLDWKVTLRTGRPHVRSYSEEKDRHVILCVDQRSSMFFSSVEVMKSVVAAEAAALLGWQVLKESDRVGLAIMHCNGVAWLRGQRSRTHWLANLRQLCAANHALSVTSRDSDATGLAPLLAMLGRLKLKNATLIVLSDWAGVTEAELTRLGYLQQHNDVLALHIADPLESTLSTAATSPWVVGDGQYQLHIAPHQLSLLDQGLAHQQQLKKDQLLRLMALKGLPLITLDTSGHHLAHLTTALGGHRR